MSQLCAWRSACERAVARACAFVSLVFSRGAWWATAVWHLRMASGVWPMHRRVGRSVARGALWLTAAVLPVPTCMVVRWPACVLAAAR